MDLSPFRGTYLSQIPLPAVEGHHVCSHVDHIEGALTSKDISSYSENYTSYLVRWHGRPDVEDSWGDDTDFFCQYTEYMASSHGRESDAGA